MIKSHAIRIHARVRLSVFEAHQEEQGEFSFGYCDHLRFILNSDLAPDDFEFSGDWDTKGFIDELEKTRPEDENEDWDLFEALGIIDHRDVTGAVFYQWHEDPMYQPWTLWGYNRD